MTLLPLQLVLASALAGAGEPNNEVLEFTAKWCGPCQKLSPLISRLQREGLPIRKIDVDENRQLTQQYRITAMPTFVVVVDGREVARKKGINPDTESPEQVLRKLCALVPVDPILVATDRVDVSHAAANAAPSHDAPDDSIAAALASTSADKPRTESKPLFGLFARKSDPVPARPAVARTQNEDLSPASEQAAGSPLLASVRIRVKDAQGGQDYGSGTIIDSREGQALVLTCGHIFRRLDQKSSVEVDVFFGDRHKTFVGKVQKFDLDADIGLVRIAADLLPVCRVAPPKTLLKKNLSVETVGCSGGERPTVQIQFITAINRYMGPDNIQCSVVPMQGRSGGGLFARNGQLIGVCAAADPKYREGLYAGLKAIHQFLDECQLTHVYRPTGAGTTVPDEAPQELAPASRNQALVADSNVGKAPATSRERLPDDAAELSRTVDEANGDALFDADVAPEDALGSEIVIIIRPRGGKKKHSKVVMLHRASRNFVEYLTGELDTQDSILETSLADAKHPHTGPRTEARRPVAAADASQTQAPRSATDTVESETYRRRR